MSTVAETARPAARPVSRSVRLRRSPTGRLLMKLPFWILVAAIFVYALFPFYWALRSAFTPEAQLFNTPIQYYPHHPTLANFRDALDSSFFRRALLNSTIVAGSVTLLSLAIGSVAAYALGRFRFHGKSFVLYLMLSMTIFPQIAILGALYTMFSGFHIIGPIDFPKLYDTPWALVFSYLIFTLPFTVWVLTSFMRALPGDLEEAAYVDGATPLQVFYKVLLPLIAPGLVTTGLLAFIAAWNEYLYAISFIQSPSHYTVPVAITSFVGKSGNAFQTPWGVLMAATVVVTLPLIAATLILQRRILAGLTAGAVKG
ncbi:MAG: trehalose/maltose transport system permease protein [Gaiellaceae bacterium]|jgi:trehalose/maltose transport system permease protein|nr:trehalose/maltose transport system permease protein [Gaiellaceae bacterium]